MFTPEKLRLTLTSLLTSRQTLWIAYSGGLDSQVLLHALATLGKEEKIQNPIHAVHINHGWSENAKQWAHYCEKTCTDLQVPCTVIEVDAKPQKGESPEASARTARYNAFAKLLNSGDYLLTAHQQDDQAETLLLQLLRGAGVKGLSSMPVIIHFGSGYHLRPLLLNSRAELHQYAKEKKLSWIDDESNQNLRFNRNFIRHEIMPTIRQRWPQATKTLTRVAEHCAQAHLLLEELARIDLCKTQGSKPNTLSIQKLLALSTARWQNLFRYWLQQQDLTLPNKAHLQRIATDILQSKKDANPQVKWDEIIICRYDDDLYALNFHFLSQHNNKSIISWSFTKPLEIKNIGTLIAKPTLGRGIRITGLSLDKITVRFRQGGERCQPTGRSGSHPLKKLMQAWHIPTWERDRIPIIYYAEEIIAVIGYCVCERYEAKYNESGWDILLT